MSRRPSAYEGPRFPDPKAVAGLTMRLAERRRVFLPLLNLPQVKDVKK